MTQRKYIVPKTEVIILNAKGNIMVVFDPNGSTVEQLGNKAEFDTEEGDPFFND